MKVNIKVLIVILIILVILYSGITLLLMQRDGVFNKNFISYCNFTITNFTLDLNKINNMSLIP